MNEPRPKVNEKYEKQLHDAEENARIANEKAEADTKEKGNDKPNDGLYTNANTHMNTANMII